MASSRTSRWTRRAGCATRRAQLRRGDALPLVPECQGSPTIHWTDPEGSPYGGTQRGPEAVLNNVFARLGAEWDDFRVEPDEFVNGGNTIVALGHHSGRNKATGKSCRTPFAHVWTLRSGKVIRFVEYADTVLMQRALQP